jgi:hypothetical protein
LRFDFYVEKLDWCIEFNGKQHYVVPTGWWGGVAGLLATQYRDGLKKAYCAEQHRTLTIIPYTDYDRIEEILTEELTKLGVLTPGSRRAV